MTLKEAILVLKVVEHRRSAGWVGWGDHTVCLDGTHAYIPAFEAIAIAEKYVRERAPLLHTGGVAPPAEPVWKARYVNEGEDAREELPPPTKRLYWTGPGGTQIEELSLSSRAPATTMPYGLP